MTKKTLIALAAPVLLWKSYRRARRLRLEGKSVVISGGSRGLGLELAREFRSAGARVALLARDADELERAQAELANYGPGREEVRSDKVRGDQPNANGMRRRQLDPDVIAVRCDVRDPDEVARAVRQVIAAFERIDVVANVAGVIDVAPYEHQTVNDIRDSLATHLWGPLHVIRFALGHMYRGGRIINVSSIGGLVSVPHLLPYSVGKFALTGYSEGLYSELANRGIYVTTVCPGLMRTGSHVRARFKGRHRQEFAWFSASSGSPLASTSARKAARKIVAACREAKPFLILTPQARALHLFHALAPNGFARAMRLTARLLPGPADGGEDGDHVREGWESASSVAPSVLTYCADRAIKRNNELDHAAQTAYFGS